MPTPSMGKRDGLLEFRKERIKHGSILCSPVPGATAGGFASTQLDSR